MLAVAILAAGKGTRMKSALPKVLQTLAETSMVERVLNSCSGLNPDRKFLIVGHQAEKVKEKLIHFPKLEFVIQTPQKGTGHAIQQLLKVLRDFKGELLVLNGDVPLLKSETLRRLINEHRRSNASVTFLTTKLSNPKGYGRVFANKNREVSRIIEDRDCSEEQKLNKLVNSGIYCFNWDQLAKVLPNLSTENNQREIYLTDTVAMLPLSMHLEVEDPGEIKGINNRHQLSQCERLLQERLREHWMENGVTFIDPSSCTLNENCTFGIDVIIEPQTHFRGNCRINNGCKIGPGSLIINSDLGESVSILYSVVNEAIIENNVSIGPFANLRPGTKLDKCSKVGNFVEIKNSSIGEKTKVNHLSYLGDAKIGKEVNIGAGTITANYDGINKHPTIIGDKSKTGANSVLVAPINLGSKVTVGAGSTLTKNVPNNALAIGRSKQLIKENWFSKESQS